MHPVREQIRVHTWTPTFQKVTSQSAVTYSLNYLFPLFFLQLLILDTFLYSLPQGYTVCWGRAWSISKGLLYNYIVEWKNSKRYKTFKPVGYKLPCTYLSDPIRKPIAFRQWLFSDFINRKTFVSSTLLNTWRNHRSLGTTTLILQTLDYSSDTLFEVSFKTNFMMMY